MKPKRMTVVDWHQMGDGVMALPFIRGALAAGIEVSACAAPGPASVWQLAFPEMRVGVFQAEVHAWWRGREWSSWRRETGSDTAVCAWADPRVHFWMKQAGFERRVGLPAEPNNCYAREAVFLRPCLRETRIFERLLDGLAGPLLTDAWSRPQRDWHHQENWSHLAQRLGFSTAEGPSWPLISSSKTERSPYWVLHSGGRLPPKRWASEKWGQLLEALRSAGLSTVWVRGPGTDAGVILPPGQEVFDAADLGGFAGLVAGARGLVGLDSFPCHLAASMGKQTVVLFGEMPDAWFAPRGSCVRVLKKPRTERRLRDYAVRDRSLLESLPVVEVAAAVMSLEAENR